MVRSNMGNARTLDSMESFECIGLKISTCSRLHEYMKFCENK